MKAPIPGARSFLGPCTLVWICGVSQCRSLDSSVGGAGGGNAPFFAAPGPLPPHGLIKAPWAARLLGHLSGELGRLSMALNW